MLLAFSMKSVTLTEVLILIVGMIALAFAIKGTITKWRKRHSGDITKQNKTFVIVIFVVICLGCFFFVSAVLVVSIVRWGHARSSPAVEAKHDRGIEEREMAADTMAAAFELLDNGLMVYYFHGNVRCQTCEWIESQSYDAVHENYADKLQSGTMGWKILNYEEPENAELAAEFKVQLPVVVLAEMRNGEIVDLQRLDQVWGLCSDETAFAEYIKSSIDAMLANADQSPVTDSSPQGVDTPIALPLPGNDTPMIDVPIPVESESAPQDESIDIEINDTSSGQLPIPIELPLPRP
jgi:hypothetical protein